MEDLFFDCNFREILWNVERQNYGSRSGRKVVVAVHTTVRTVLPHSSSYFTSSWEAKLTCQ